MDHHFLPSEPTPHVIHVPYVCDPPQDGKYTPYDGGPFVTYPSRIGKDWLLPGAEGSQNEMVLERRRHFTSTPEQEKIIQSWAFFGLLATFLRSTYNAQDFIEEREDGVFITTKLLTTKMVEAWESRGAHASDEEKQEQFQNAVRCLRVSANLLSACREDFDWRIKLSIQSVKELFGRTMNRAYAAARIKAKSPPMGVLFSTFPIGEIREQMLAAGWCPSEISSMSQRFGSLQTLVFLSRVDKRSGGRSHANCSDQQCVACQIDRHDYSTAHFTEGCTCKTLPVDVEAICRILETSALPILEISKLDEAQPEVRVMASGSQTPFTALSHVWADGLGNPDKNELPTCQVLQVGRLVADMQKQKRPGSPPQHTVHVWIDTICCPVSPPWAKATSIRRMRETYTTAETVLVLEKSLRAQPYKSRPPIEPVLAVLTSAWCQRLWTLQEAWLPPSLWVQFADGPADLDELYKETFMSRMSDVRMMSLVEDVHGVWMGLGRLRHLDPSVKLDTTVTLHMLDQSLLNRSVSYAADEPLCISTLLDVPLPKDDDTTTNHLADGDPPATSLAEARMASLWRSVAATRGGLPQSMILLSYPRMRQRGFRWAPRTLLHPVGTGARIMQWEDLNRGQVTPRGFAVHFTGMRLSLRSRRNGGALAANSPAHADIHVGISFHARGERCVFYLNEAMTVARTAFERYPRHAELMDTELALLLVHQVFVGKTGGLGDWAAVLAQIEEEWLEDSDGDSDSGSKNGPVVRIICPVVFHAGSAVFGPGYDAADEVIERALAEQEQKAQQGSRPHADTTTTTSTHTDHPAGQPPFTPPPPASVTQTSVTGSSAADPSVEVSSPTAPPSTTPPATKPSAARPQDDDPVAAATAVVQTTMQRHARAVLSERPAARAALEALYNSADPERLAEVLGYMASAGVRYEVARAERHDDAAWCIS